MFLNVLLAIVKMVTMSSENESMALVRFAYVKNSQEKGFFFRGRNRVTDGPTIFFLTRSYLVHLNISSVKESLVAARWVL